jgi:hypothetical protein
LAALSSFFRRVIHPTSCYPFLLPLAVTLPFLH